MLTEREQEIKERLDDMNGYELYGQNGLGLNKHTQNELFSIAEELLETVRLLREKYESCTTK